MEAFHSLFLLFPPPSLRELQKKVAMRKELAETTYPKWFQMISKKMVRRGGRKGGREEGREGGREGGSPNIYLRESIGIP
jgi:hypothetical protein